MTAHDDEATWERLRKLMPRHDCGRRLEPGGHDGNRWSCA